MNLDELKKRREENFLAHKKKKKEYYLKRIIENIKECKQVLLFFNIETCVRQQQNQNEQVNNQEFYTYYRFHEF